jgi:hypothetical protein
VHISRGFQAYNQRRMTRNDLRAMSMAEAKQYVQESQAIVQDRLAAARRKKIKFRWVTASAVGGVAIIAGIVVVLVAGPGGKSAATQPTAAVNNTQSQTGNDWAAAQVNNSSNSGSNSGSGETPDPAAADTGGQTATPTTPTSKPSSAPKPAAAPLPTPSPSPSPSPSPTPQPAPDPTPSPAPSPSPTPPPSDPPPPPPDPPADPPAGG